MEYRLVDLLLEIERRLSNVESTYIKRSELNIIIKHYVTLEKRIQILEDKNKKEKE